MSDIRRRPLRDFEQQNTLLPTEPWNVAPPAHELLPMLYGMACWAARRCAQQYSATFPDDTRKHVRPGVPSNHLREFIFEILQRRAHKIVAADNPQALGRTIAKGAAIDYLRRRGSNPEVPLEHSFSIGQDDDTTELDADSSVPYQFEKHNRARHSGLDNADVWWDAYRQEQIERALDSLPEVERKIIGEWKGFGGTKTLEQVAEEFGYSTRYLRTLTHRALGRLRKSLVDWNPYRRSPAAEKRNIWLATQREISRVLQLVDKPDGYAGRRIEVYHELDLEFLNSLMVPFRASDADGLALDAYKGGNLLVGIGSIGGDKRSSVGQDIPRQEYEEILERLAADWQSPDATHPLYSDRERFLRCMKFFGVVKHLAYLEDLRRGLREAIAEAILEGILEEAGVMETFVKLNATLERLAAAVERLDVKKVNEPPDPISELPEEWQAEWRKIQN